MAKLPQKLKKDAIAEAICEIRFVSQESNEVPELVIGQLAGYQRWSNFQRKRLPASEVPSSIRRQLPDFQNQPVMEFRSEQSARVVKIGSNVISYHALAPYPGWTNFQPELEELVNFVFGTFTGFQAARLGFRYVNLLTAGDHHLSDITSLNYSIQVAGTKLQAPLNLNYQVARDSMHNVLVRIASPEFVTGHTKGPFVALIDIDIFTPGEFLTNDRKVATDWIDKAHLLEKEEFFKLFTSEMLEELVEE